MDAAKQRIEMYQQKKQRQEEAAQKLQEQRNQREQRKQEALLEERHALYVAFIEHEKQKDEGLI